MKRRVELYGPLRDAGFGGGVLLEVPPRAAARDVLAALKSALGARAGLAAGCALATDDAVLLPDERVPTAGRLAALPPVCGG